MPRRINFSRVQTVTIEFADAHDTPEIAAAKDYWTAWANNMFSGGPAIDVMLKGLVPNDNIVVTGDNIVVRDEGKWEAITAENRPAGFYLIQMDPDAPTEPAQWSQGASCWFVCGSEERIPDRLVHKVICSLDLLS